jgi:hypothetical protein
MKLWTIDGIDPPGRVSCNCRLGEPCTPDSARTQCRAASTILGQQGSLSEEVSDLPWSGQMPGLFPGPVVVDIFGAQERHTLLQSALATALDRTADWGRQGPYCNGWQKGTIRLGKEERRSLDSERLCIATDLGGVVIGTAGRLISVATVRCPNRRSTARAGSRARVQTSWMESTGIHADSNAVVWFRTASEGSPHRIYSRIYRQMRPFLPGEHGVLLASSPVEIKSSPTEGKNCPYLNQSNRRVQTGMASQQFLNECTYRKPANRP